MKFTKTTSGPQILGIIFNYSKCRILQSSKVKFLNMKWNIEFNEICTPFQWWLLRHQCFTKWNCWWFRWLFLRGSDFEFKFRISSPKSNRTVEWYVLWGRLYSIFLRCVIFESVIATKRRITQFVFRIIIYNFPAIPLALIKVWYDFCWTVF